jgi:hypothetical protein
MTTQPPLTNLQMELLQLYSLKLSDNELLQGKEVLARYFAGRLGQHVDQLWQERGLTEDDMERWLIDADARTLTWPNGADFDPQTLRNWPEYKDDLAARAQQWDLVLV